MARKKEKSKARLDKFYHIAKEQGYRSRAAFKLIQLNKKYDFLSKAAILVDLCAAPGGWLQVASKYMGNNSILIGVDLDPIKPIPKVKTFQEDITTPECISAIRREIKTAKVDVVLNDGAPNVGANWKKDAFTQSELVLHSLSLACKLLRKGGSFVTKVFRSADYNSLIWTMNKFFDKVEATKPEASRHTSAEIFVVCMKFKAPDYIDPKFFDPNYVFKENEASLLALLTAKEVASIDKIFERRDARRKEIADSDPQNLFKKATFTDFIQAKNPYPFFVDFNKIEISKEEEEKYLHLAKHPEDYKDLLSDLVLLGKRDVSILLKWRTKILQKLEKKEKKEGKEIFNSKQTVDPTKAKFDEEEDVEAELDKIKKKADRREQKDREKRLAQYAKQGLLPGEGQVVEFEQEVSAFDFSKHADEMRKGEFAQGDDETDEEEKETLRKNPLGGIHHVYKKHQPQEVSYLEMEDQIEREYEMMKAFKGEQYRVARERDKERRLKKQKEDGKHFNVEEKELEIQDEEVKALSKRAPRGAPVEVTYEEDPDIDLKLLKNSRFFDRDAFNVLNIQKKLKVQDFSEEEVEEENNAMEEEGQSEEDQLQEEDIEDDDDVYEDGSEEDDDDDFGSDEEDNDGHFEGDNGDFEINTNVAQSKVYLEDLKSKSMSKSDIKQQFLKEKIEKKRKKINTEKEAKANEEDSESDHYAAVRDTGDATNENPHFVDIGTESSDDPFQNEEYDGRYDIKVPLTEMEKRKKILKRQEKKKEKKELKEKGEHEEIKIVPAKSFEDYNPDELAEDLAIAKKMLRKKDRMDIIDQGINRYNYLEKPEDLPDWFVEDERKHTVLNMPITKEEVLEEKMRLRALNTMQPRKIMEAKIRKKNKLVRELKRFKDKAEDIFQTEGLDGKTKMREIEKMKNRAFRKSKAPQKQYIVSNKSTTGPSAGRKTQGRKYKVVDKRLKNDIKALKRAEKNKGRSKSQKRSKSSTAGNKRFKRRK